MQRLNVQPNADDSLLVKFRLEAMVDDAATIAAGGETKWKNVEFLEIHIPGDRTQIFEGPVTDSHRTRFASRYEKWKRGQQEMVDGTPLSQWPGITPAEVQMLAQAGIHSVEALAGVSDGNIGKVGRAVALRDKARRYLENVRANAPLEAMEAKLREEQGKVSDLSEKVNRLLAALEAKQAEGEADGAMLEASPEAPLRRGPGRPPKHPRPE
jgi:hypothetical protein